MSKQRGTIDKFQNTIVTLGSGLKVEFDRTIHPKAEDVRYVMGKLYKSRYIDDLTPAYAVPELFVRYTSEQLKELIPHILRSMDELVRNGEVMQSDELLITASATVLGWYAHWNFGGIRPIFVTPEEKKREAYRQKITPTEPEQRCPYCNKKFPIIPKNSTKYSDMARHWHGTMLHHYAEYHKWEWAIKELAAQKKSRTRTKEVKPES